MSDSRLIVEGRLLCSDTGNHGGFLLEIRIFWKTLHVIDLIKKKKTLKKLVVASLWKQIIDISAEKINDAIRLNKNDAHPELYKATQIFLFYAV